MVFAEFQKMSVPHDGKPSRPIPMLGSDGVYVLDARKSRVNQIADAKLRIESLKAIHGNQIIGFIIFRGRSFSDGQPILKFVSVE